MACRPNGAAARSLGLCPARLARSRIATRCTRGIWPVLGACPGNRATSIERGGLCATCVVVAIVLAELTYLLIESPLRSWTWLGGNAVLSRSAPTECVVVRGRARGVLAVGPPLRRGRAGSLHSLSCACRCCDRRGGASADAVPSKSAWLSTLARTAVAGGNAGPPTSGTVCALRQRRHQTLPRHGGGSKTRRRRSKPWRAPRARAAARRKCSIRRAADQLSGRPWYYWRCMEGVKGSVQCIDGDPRASKTVSLVGDSHAGDWSPAVDQLAERVPASRHPGQGSRPPVRECGDHAPGRRAVPGVPDLEYRGAAPGRRRVPVCGDPPCSAAIRVVVYQGALDSWE